jgi:hypothetical protein
MPRSRPDNIRAMQNGGMNRLPVFGSTLLALLALVPFDAGAQDIYKCMQGGQVVYTDQPCPVGKGELLHQADATETIDYYLRLGQDGLAAAWAKARHLDALYRERLAIHRAAQDARAEQARQAAELAQQQAEQARAQARQAAALQAQAEQADERVQLQAENDALREQNATYQAELSQPTYLAPPYGWAGSRPYPPFHPPRSDRHEPGQPHARHPPPVRDQPLVKNCTTRAGGRVQC